MLALLLLAAPADLAHLIDREIDAKLKSAAPPATDAEFLRRVHLDLAGRLPSPERAKAFLDSKDAAKREKLLDELLSSKDFGQRFAGHWTTLFVKRNDANPRMHTVPFRAWLAARLDKGPGFDRAVRDMLTATGEGPETLFLATNREKDLSPSRTAATSAALFLGIPLQCAECHDHPTNPDWKREDFWGMAAFFSRTRAGGKKKTKDAPGPVGFHDVDESPRVFVARPDPRKPPPPPGERLPSGVLEIPSAFDPMKRVGRAPAKYLGGKDASLPEKGSHRAPFAEWLTSADNPWFARAIVNRTWSQLFARGLVNPLDGMGPDNEPSHPAILDLLAREFVSSGFDLKHIVRILCLTKAYARSSAGEGDETLFGRMPVKAIDGPTLVEMLDGVLGKSRGGQPARGKKGTRLKTLPELLDTAGYDESFDAYTSGVPQALRLMNSVLPERADAAGAIFAKSADPVERVYLAALSRRPTERERRAVESFLAKRKSSAAGMSALLWVLLSSPEFMTNP